MDMIALLRFYVCVLVLTACDYSSCFYALIEYLQKHLHKHERLERIFFWHNHHSFYPVVPPLASLRLYIFTFPLSSKRLVKQKINDSDV